MKNHISTGVIKQAAFLVVILSVMSIGLDAFAASKKAQMVYSTSTDGYLNIREEPNAEAYILDVLFTGGDGATFISKSGNWYYVDYNGQKGYVSAKYAVCSASKPAVKKLERTLYYVVIGSYENLENAKNAAENLPDALLSPVYRVVENGKERYRICTACFYDKEEAQRWAGEIKETFSSDAWIWQNKGFAACVYRPGSLYDGAISISPLTPR